MIQTITAHDLLQMQLEPPRMIVDGLLSVGLNILASPPKTGKSMLCLSLASAVSKGASVFGKYQSRPGRVLYCALEDHFYRLQKRYRELHLPSSEALHFTTELQPFASGGIEALHEEMAANPETSLVIIDTLARVKPGARGGNVYEEDTDLGGALQALAFSHDAAILLVTHTRKENHADFLYSISGSAGLPGTADVVAVLSRKRGEPGAKLEFTARDFEGGELDLTWNPIAGGWTAAR